MPGRPPITGTTHPLPYDQLAPRDFERSALWLVHDEGYTRAEGYGSQGSEQGRDVAAYRRDGSGKELFYFQCKRSRRGRATEFKGDIDKVVAVRHDASPHIETTIVFILSCLVTAGLRDAVKNDAANRGFQREIWARDELDMRVKKHPRIIREFFRLPGSEVGNEASTEQVLAACRKPTEAAIRPALRPSPTISRPGAEAAIRELVSSDTRYVVLIGPSGVGKPVALASIAVAIRQCLTAGLAGDPDLLVSALLAAASLRDAQQVDHAITILSARSSSARSAQAAAKLLSEVPDRRAVPALLLALRSWDMSSAESQESAEAYFTVRQILAARFGTVGDDAQQAVLDTLQQALQDAGALGRVPAIWEIKKLSLVQPPVMLLRETLGWLLHSEQKGCMAGI